MGINKEVWISTINENVFQQSSFMDMGTDHSAYVNNATVHVPNAGALPTIVQNRSSFPGTVTQRTDNDLTYNLNEYSATPFLLQYSEELEVNYDKRNSLLYALTQTLHQTIGNQTAYAWALPNNAGANFSGRTFSTTGAADSTKPDGATGTRLAVTLSDIAKLKTSLDTDLMPDADRTVVIPSAIWNNQMLQLAALTQVLQYGVNSVGTKEGVLEPASIPGFAGKIYGMNVITRPNVVVYSATSSAHTSVALTAIGDNGTPTTTNANDCFGIIAFQKMAVSNAKGDTKIFYEAERAEYYGSLFSAVVRHGAARLRSDGKGVAALVQG
jgi:hypothetical protein